MSNIPPFNTRQNRWSLESFVINQNYQEGGIPFTSRALNVIEDGFITPIMVGGSSPGGVGFGASGMLLGWAGTFSGQVFHVRIHAAPIMSSGALASGLLPELGATAVNRIASGGFFKAWLTGH